MLKKFLDPIFVIFQSRNFRYLSHNLVFLVLNKLIDRKALKKFGIPIWVSPEISGFVS